jgi:tetratricopeptide (TPR) repeat protein
MADKPKIGFIKLGTTQKLLKKSNEARDSFFKAAALDPSDVEPLFLVGQLYLETKQPSEARQQFQRVLNINKDYPLVNYNIGLANLQMGLLEDTLEQANIEKLKNPNLADPYILAADAYTAMKQYSACAGEYQQAVKYRPSSSDLFIKIARCYRMAGNLDAAVSMINQASSLESGNAEVWKEQAAIYEMKQDRIKAIEAYNQYKVLAPNAPDIDQVDARINALSGGAN